jgi:hypothetical protein
VALLAAALLAINPMAIWYSQVARSYALVVLAACLAFGALARALRRPERRATWGLYVAGMVLMAYSDLLAPVIVLPAQALMVWAAAGGAAGSRRELARRFIYALSATVVLCTPLLVAALTERSRRDPLYWLPKLGRGLVEAAIEEFAGGLSGVKAVGWLTLAVGGVLVGAAVLVLRRPDTRGPREGLPAREAEAGRRALAAAGAWGVLPPAGLLLISAAVPVFWPRYSIAALPGLCLLLALSAGVLLAVPSRRWLAAGGVGLLLCLGVYADARQVDAVQQEWKPLGAWLGSTRRSREPVVVDSVLMMPSLGYYDRALRARGGELVVREWKDEPLPAGVFGFKDPAGYGASADGPPPPALIRKLARRGDGTVWLIIGETSGRAGEFPAVRWANEHCRVTAKSDTRIEVLRVSGCR